MTRSTMPLRLVTTVLGCFSIVRCVSAFRSATANTPLIARPRNEVHSPVKIDDKAVHKHVWSSSLPTSADRSSSSLSAFPTPNFAVVGAGVATFYKASPLLAGFLTASTKAAFADSAAQYRDVSTSRFDAKRNLSMALYSGLVLGVSCEIMYNSVFPRMFGLEGGVKRALKMTLFDGFVNAPLLWLPPAYVVKAMVFRYSKREAMRKYVVDVKEKGLLKKYWSLWLPMTMINFMFVPVHFRVAFVALISFFWMIILSIVANNGN